VPEWEIQETIRHVPKIQVQSVTVEVAKHVNRYFEQVEHIPTVLQEEHPVEVPEVAQVEMISEVPVPRVEKIQKAIPKYVIEPREVFVEVPTVLRQERAVEVPEVQVVEVVREVARVNTQIVDKAVPRPQLQCLERSVDVPIVLQREVIVPIPQQQVVEALVEEFAPSVQKVNKTARPEPLLTAVAASMCAACGSSFPADASFCVRCGAPRPEVFAARGGMTQMSSVGTATPPVLGASIAAMREYSPSRVYQAEAVGRVVGRALSPPRVAAPQVLAASASAARSELSSSMNSPGFTRYTEAVGQSYSPLPRAGSPVPLSAARIWNADSQPVAFQPEASSFSGGGVPELRREMPW